MTLTTEQIEAIQHGQPVTVAPTEVGTECVLVRRDVFERLKSLLAAGREFDPRDAYPLVNEVMATDDANDPWLDSYQQP